MSKYIIEGGHRLRGEYKVKGAKNSVLPIMAATVAIPGEYCITNCPKISDVEDMAQILIHLGIGVFRYGDSIFIDSTQIDNVDVPEDLMKRLRSSVFITGALLGRCGEAFMASPGGCNIGERATDLHFYGFSRLGAQVKKEGCNTQFLANKLMGCKVPLDIPSVGATINIMLAALGAKETTTIINGAREPEIVDLQCFLNQCGARIKGAGTWKITIDGHKNKGRVWPGKPYSIMGDRIEAATYLVATRGTRGDVVLTGISPYVMKETLNALRETDGTVTTGRSFIKLKGDKPIKGGLHIETNPYPGFPTDCQQIFMSLLSYGDKKSVITESVFENRFSLGNILNYMGGNIEINGKNAIIDSIKKYQGKAIHATDLRCGAALIVAGLMAEGRTTIFDTDYIKRGYEEIKENIRNLGGKIDEEIDF